MPFQPGAETDTGPSTSTLQVDPAQVLGLKAELQPIYDEVDLFLQNYGQSMVMRPLGADAVSRDTADTFNENTQSALAAARGYLDALKGVLDALDQAAKTYDLIEDSNANRFRQGAQ
jgi:uncharacterized protein YukE